jgi:hypothetical protein
MPEPDQNEPIRIRDKDTGAKFTIRRVSLPHGNYQELKSEDAVNPLTGEFLAPEFPEADSGQSTKKEG